MSEAALNEDIDLSNDLGQETEQVDVEVEQAESAPAVEEKPPVEDGFQKRINKVTADKYEQQRRADELQRKLDELQSKPKAVEKAPTLEEFDHDEDAYNAALINHQVQKAVKAQADEQATQAEQARAQEAQKSFNERIVAMNKPDFADVANAVPQLPSGVADALVQSDSGPELIYHLGTHLDVADKLAAMTPQAAMMELGRISASMNTKTETKLSAAPDPIEPINSGGSLTKEKGPEGATYE